MTNTVGTLDWTITQEIVTAEALRKSVVLSPDGRRQLQSRLAHLNIQAKRFREAAARCANKHCKEVYDSLAEQIEVHLTTG